MTDEPRKLVATVFYGGRVYEILAPESGSDIDWGSFQKSLCDVVGNPHDPSILSAAYHVRLLGGSPPSAPILAGSAG